MQFSTTAGDYARLLIANGFTVYAPTRSTRPVHWFHYSRTIDGHPTPLYGTFTDGSESFDGPDHSMPIKPSRLNGSGAHVGAGRHLSPLSVEYAALVARPTNYCPWNYPVTPENTRRANAMQPMPKRAATGATLANAEPWGIGDRYHPIAADMIETA